MPIGIGAGRFGSTCLIARIAIERDVLVVQDRIGIGDGRGHQRARVFGRRRHDDLQARRAIEPRLGVLAVIRAGVAQAAPRHAHDHRHFAAPAIADLRGVVDELIESGGDEIVELHFADRPQPGQRGADAHAEHGAFGERRVADAIAVLLEQRAQQQERVAVLAADVLAVDEHARIGAQRIADAEHHGFEEGAALLVERQARVERRQLRAIGRLRAAAPARAARTRARRFVLEHADAGLLGLRPRRLDHELRLRDRRARRPTSSLVEIARA